MLRGCVSHRMRPVHEGPDKSAGHSSGNMRQHHNFSAYGTCILRELYSYSIDISSTVDLL